MLNLEIELDRIISENLAFEAPARPLFVMSKLLDTINGLELQLDNIISENLAFDEAPMQPPDLSAMSK